MIAFRALLLVRHRLGTWAPCGVYAIQRRRPSLLGTMLGLPTWLNLVDLQGNLTKMCARGVFDDRQILVQALAAVLDYARATVALVLLERLSCLRKWLVLLISVGKLSRMRRLLLLTDVLALPPLALPRHMTQQAPLQKPGR